MSDDFDFSQFPNACRIIAEHELDVDLKYLSIMEFAELNLATACIELFYNFKAGINGFPVNYEMARYYADKLIEIAYADETENKDLMKFDIHKNAGYMEASFDNYDLAVKELTKAAEIMPKLPEDKWDEQILEYLSEYQNYV